MKLDMLTQKANRMSSPIAVLKPDEIDRMHAYWRAANYLSVGQIYLLDNPLLKQPLTRAHIKPRLLGHYHARPELHLRSHEPGDQTA